MPLEVRQIGIRLTVGESAAAAGRAAPALVRGPGRLSASERRAIVEDCVAAVLAALKAQEER